MLEIHMGIQILTWENLTSQIPVCLALFSGLTEDENAAQWDSGDFGDTPVLRSKTNRQKPRKTHPRNHRMVWVEMDLNLALNPCVHWMATLAKN